MNKIKSLILMLFNKETILYLVFGVLTTIINIAVAKLSYDALDYISPVLQTALSNCIAWIAGLIFAFITNKLYVFESKSFDTKVLIKEASSFTGARLLSLIVDLLGMYLLVNISGFNFTISKIVMNVVVVIINYVLSKLFIFKKNVEEQQA